MPRPNPNQNGDRHGRGREKKKERRRRERKRYSMCVGRVLRGNIITKQLLVQIGNLP